MATAPRLFISYSWSTPEHEQWVLDLASSLVGSGVDVVLDKWALREGHDAIAFMEQMVTDPSITKVALICDRHYARKADERAGGVGTETQIISADIYAKQAQDKFVAVIAEKDDAGRAVLPTYYRSRIYIDLSESERYAENYEKLVRWIFDKPLHVRPELGKAPAYIDEPDAPTLSTSALARRAVDALRTDKGYVGGALDEYFSTFAQHLERFRIAGGEGRSDDEVVKSIESFLPARNELIGVLATLAQYSDTITHVARVHRFLESLVPYLSPSRDGAQWGPFAIDNFRFVVHEMFLYTLAILLRAGHLKASTYLLSQPYCAEHLSTYGGAEANSFTVFRDYLESFNFRNQRLQLRRLSVRADLLRERAATSGVTFQHLMQADFVSFMRASLDSHIRWWPETLVYAAHQHRPFEIFARATSLSYLPDVLDLLGAENVSAVKGRLAKFAENQDVVPRWGFERIDPAALIGIDQLGTRK